MLLKILIFSFLHKFSQNENVSAPNLAFLDENFQTRRFFWQFSNSPKFREGNLCLAGYNACLPLQMVTLRRTYHNIRLAVGLSSGLLLNEGEVVDHCFVLYLVCDVVNRWSHQTVIFSATVSAATRWSRRSTSRDCSLQR